MRLDIKLINVPPTNEVLAESIRDLNSRHLNKLIIIFGTVVRTGNVNSRELQKYFKCRQCGEEYVCESDITEYNNFNLPKTCTGRVQKKENPFFKIAQNMMNKQNGKQTQPRKKSNDDGMTNCRSRNFVEMENPGPAEFADYQEIKV